MLLEYTILKYLLLKCSIEQLAGQFILKSWSMVEFTRDTGGIMVGRTGGPWEVSTLGLILQNDGFDPCP